MARSAQRRQRADARMNVEAILDAATGCLARDPDASVTEIATAAGVGRVTLYGHFASRAALVEAAMERAIAQTQGALDDADLDGDPRVALERLIGTTWKLTDRFGALVVAAERTLPAEKVHAAHAGPMQRVAELVERGRREGAFRTDVPTHWLVTVLHQHIHAAATAVHRGEIVADEAPRLIATTTLAAFTPPDEPVPALEVLPG